MATIHDPWRDDVGGTVIGDIMMTGVLMYEDRPQSQNISAKTEDDILDIAKKKKNKIANDLGSVFKLIYPRNKWWVKIYNF